MQNSIRLPPLKSLAICALQALSPFAWSQNNPASAAAPPTPAASIRRFELGGQVIDMRTGGCFQFPPCNTPRFGLGVGAPLTLTSLFALDSNFNVLRGSIV